MRSSRSMWLWTVAIAGWLLLPVAHADLPPSCLGLPCDLQSELVIFSAGTSHEIVATIVDCTSCSDPGGGPKFDLQATLQVAFGPYDPAIGCLAAGDSNVAEIQFDGDVGLYPAGGPVEHYYPYDPNAVVDAWPLTESLDTECVDASWLDYTIPLLRISDAAGAWTADVASGWAATLTLPESVRSTSGSRIDLPEFRLSQGLAFTLVESYAPSSTFRLWPEGLPFRLGAQELTYRPNEVLLSFDAASGPTPYEVARPDPSTLPSDGYVVHECTHPQTGVTPCDSTPVWNAGYLDSPSWSPHDGRFDLAGMDVDLYLDDAFEVLYRPLFPQGSWIRFIGPSDVFVQDGAIAGGNFSAGKAWVENREGMGWCEQVYRHELDLPDGPVSRPQITRDGGLVAPVLDLNQVESLKWMKNEASGLGCGTLWVPPVVNDVLDGSDVVGPQHEWLRSAESSDLPGLLSDPVNGRGLYAGFNYNRNRTCVGSDELCGVDADCGPGGQCEVDRWSPLCPAVPASGFDPQWTTSFQDEILVKGIHPDEGEKEMVLVARASGVTGVFDAGNEPFTIDQPFEMELNSFGHAFRASQSEWADTIIRGGLRLGWPSDTTIPFNDMTMCNCGSVKSAGSGEPPTLNRLAYWDASFYPYGLSFLESAADPCGEAAPTACEQDVASAAAVCVEATMPIPHFDPTPTVSFRVQADGQADQIVPLDTPLFEFEAVKPPDPLLPPYEYAAEQFLLSSWDAAGQPDSSEVPPYGYFDSEGDLALPLFGQVPAGIRVQSLDGIGHYEVDLHREDDPGVSYIDVTKKVAADKLELSYRVDYFRPESTAVDDGTNENGRGLMLGYSGLQGSDRHIDLGSIKVPSAVILTPDSIVGDIGPSGSMRLWGATEGEGRTTGLASILPGDNLLPTSINVYESALTALGQPGPALSPPDDAYIETLYSTGAINFLAFHPDQRRSYNTSANDPGMDASFLTGYLDITPVAHELERIVVDANIDTGGEFFAMERSTLTVDRHVKHNSPEQPIAQIGRRDQPGNMALPGKMSVPFPGVPGMQWDFDYDFSGPTPVFRSLTGSLDLTQGGLSGIGFDRAGMTLKYWNDGDWYFDAGLELQFNGYSAYGDILLGNTKNLDPLWAKDPTVADFLGPIPSFRGGYARVGASGRIFDYGCLFRVSAGFEVGGWYITDSYGGKLRGWVSGRGACIVSVRGDLTLLGGSVGDRFKMTGFMWVGGGIGLCEEEDWDSPEDVLDDDFCASCVISGSVTGITPPRFKLSMEGPDADCSL